MEVFTDNGSTDVETTSSSFTTVKTLTCDRSGEAGAKDFLVGAFGSIRSSDGNALAGYRVTVGGTEIAKVGDTTNDQLDVIGSSRYWLSCVIKKTSITNASVDIDMDAKVDTGTWRSRGHSIFAVEFGSDWEYAESDGESSTDSTTMQDKTTLTFTPSSQDDYYIIATAEVMMEDETSPAECALDIDGTDEELWNPLGLQASGNDNRYVMVGFALKKNLDASEHDIKIQYRTTKSGGADTAFIRNARIVAIPAGGEFILNAYDDIDDTKETTDTATFSSFTTIENHNITANAGNHLAFGYMKFGAIANTEEVAAKVDFDGTDFMGARLKDADTDATTEQWHVVLGGAVMNIDAGSTDFKLRAAESAGTETEEFDQKHLIILEIGDAVAANTRRYSLPMLGVG